ncbi:hypothetical protein PINS_up002913 [Pythium insidiosum]|nr:hypothetical protein PINS_up002913 [Pythium insidiosum]
MVIASLLRNRFSVSIGNNHGSTLTEAPADSSPSVALNVARVPNGECQASPLSKELGGLRSCATPVLASDELSGGEVLGCASRGGDVVAVGAATDQSSEKPTRQTTLQTARVSDGGESFHESRSDEGDKRASGDDGGESSHESQSEDSDKPVSGDEGGESPDDSQSEDSDKRACGSDGGKSFHESRSDEGDKRASGDDGGESSHESQSEDSDKPVSGDEGGESPDDSQSEAGGDRTSNADLVFQPPSAVSGSNVEDQCDEDSSDSDDSVVEVTSTGRPKRNVGGVRRPLTNDTDSRDSGSEDSEDSEDTDDSVDSDTDAVAASRGPGVQQHNGFGKVVRQAARAARDAIRRSDWRQWGSARKRRRRPTEESKEEGGSDDDDPGYVEALLNRIVDKKEDGGVVYYRVEWAEPDDGDDKYSWEPVEHLDGHEDWMKLVDMWKAKYETKMSFAKFLKNNRQGLRVGDGDMMRCFFFAVEAVRKALNLSPFDLDSVVVWLEKKGWDFNGGVKKDALQPLIEVLSKCGLGIDYKVWSKNIHESHMGDGPEGVARALPAESATYMVGTMDPRRIGHCWVLTVDEDGMMTAVDNGSEVEFSEIKFREILWVRRCVPFVMARRNRKRKNSAHRGPRLDKACLIEAKTKRKRCRRSLRGSAQIS